jgi:putative ABC transport system substrate-binding protein
MQIDHLRRRDFITAFGGAAAGWPLAVHAQQLDRMRRIGVLMDTAESNPEGRLRIATLRQGLQERGWTEGRNVRIDYRWAGGDAARSRGYAMELVGFKPDVIFAYANAQLRPLSQETRTIPIVFVGASDPVGAGYATSFARPGGNITGFTLFEASMAGKWLGLLKEMAPAIVRVAIMVNPDTGMLRGSFYLHAFETAAAALKVEPATAVVRNASDIEAAIAALGQRYGSGLIVAPDGFAQAHDESIVALAIRHRVPAIYGPANFAKLGGLMSYGPDLVDVCRRAAGHIDRILRGENPAELPIEAPTLFKMIVNLKTARALGLEVPPMLLARADEVIE